MGTIKSRVIWRNFNPLIGILDDYYSKNISIVSIDNTSDDVIRDDGFDQDCNVEFDSIGCSTIIFLYASLFYISDRTNVTYRWEPYNVKVEELIRVYLGCTDKTDKTIDDVIRVDGFDRDDDSFLLGRIKTQHFLILNNIRGSVRVQTNGKLKIGDDVIRVDGFDRDKDSFLLGPTKVQQTLVLNNIRDSVQIQTNGQLMTGRNVSITCLFRAKESIFNTALLIAMVILKCNLNKYSVGITTKNEKLRRKFPGQHEHIMNYLYFIAAEVRNLEGRSGNSITLTNCGKVNRRLRDTSNL